MLSKAVVSYDFVEDPRPIANPFRHFRLLNELDNQQRCRFGGLTLSFPRFRTRFLFFWPTGVVASGTVSSAWGKVRSSSWMALSSGCRGMTDLRTTRGSSALVCQMRIPSRGGSRGVSVGSNTAQLEVAPFFFRFWVWVAEGLLARRLNIKGVVNPRERKLRHLGSGLSAAMLAGWSIATRMQRTSVETHKYWECW